MTLPLFVPLSLPPSPPPTLFLASSIIYFANQSSIDRLVDNVAVPVIQVGTEPLSLDCNSCDDRIYWSTDHTIMRSFANSSTIETVSMGMRVCGMRMNS